MHDINVMSTKYTYVMNEIISSRISKISIMSIVKHNEKMSFIGMLDRLWIWSNFMNLILVDPLRLFYSVHVRCLKIV